MSTLSENQIIDIIYSLYETDDAGWETTSSEYLTSRAFCNAAIHDWEMRTTWRDLFSTLTAAADGTKTITAGTYSYLCPTNFVYPNGWVRTVRNNIPTFWLVRPSEMVPKLADSTDFYCYFTGSVKGGFYLNFNSKKTLNTGDTINYEYYATPTLLITTSSTTEIPDPYYLVYYSLARLLKNDGEDFSYEETKAREIMDNMLTNNIQGFWDINNPIEESLNQGVGFGS